MNDEVNVSTNVTEPNHSEEQLPSVSLNNEGGKNHIDGLIRKLKRLLSLKMVRVKMSL